MMTQPTWRVAKTNKFSPDRGGVRPTVMALELAYRSFKTASVLVSLLYPCRYPLRHPALPVLGPSMKLPRPHIEWTPIAHMHISLSQTR